MKQRKKIVIGLVGEVCAGKSAVANAFRAHGAEIYDADRNVHELYRDPAVAEQVRKMFGTEAMDAQGGVDRKALGRIVFNDPKLLKRLTEEIVFPRATEAMKQALGDFKRSPAPALVLDAPTLFESGRDDLCDYIVFVTAPLERRLAWAKARGWDEKELNQRESRLSRQSEKKQCADLLIGNKGTLEDIDRSVAECLRKWTASLE